jgi:hypothetical protein
MEEEEGGRVSTFLDKFCLLNPILYCFKIRDASTGHKSTMTAGTKITIAERVFTAHEELLLWKSSESALRLSFLLNPLHRKQ